MTETEVKVTCARCGGTGRATLSRKLEETYKLLQSRDHWDVNELIKEMDPTHLLNRQVFQDRLVRLEKLGLLTKGWHEGVRRYYPVRKDEEKAA